MTPPREDDTMTRLSEEQRIDRMRKVWVAEGPSNFEVAAARTRIMARAQVNTRRESRLGPGKLLADLSVGLGLAVVAVLALNQFGGAEEPETHTGPIAEVKPPPVVAPVEVDTPQIAPQPAAHAEAPRIERGSEVTQATPGVTYEVARGEKVTVVFGGERTEVAGPRLIEFTFEADRASGFRMHLSTPTPADRAPQASAPAAPHKADAQHAGTWSRVAEAMRRGDERGAEAALRELSDNGRGADSAALALAQLWIARGEQGRARPVLERLSRESESAVVRRRAAELLTP